MYRVQQRTELSSKWSGTSGTSASTPVAAGMFSNINAARLAVGKGSIGWIHPALYMYSSLFVNDVTKGNNKDGPTCPQGFYATPGWDPTTGLGSINYGKFEAVMLSLGTVNAMDRYPTKNPAGNLVQPPTSLPISRPSASPISSPTNLPSEKPMFVPTETPTARPIFNPTTPPTYRAPSRRPMRSGPRRPPGIKSVSSESTDGLTEAPPSQVPGGNFTETPSSGVTYPLSRFLRYASVFSAANVISISTNAQGTITPLLIGYT